MGFRVSAEKIDNLFKYHNLIKKPTSSEKHSLNRDQIKAI
jgi:hypothetical protein